MQQHNGEHITVGVEIKPNDLSTIHADHPHKTPQYQRMQVTQDIVRDTTKVTINNPDMKEFRIMFTDPANNKNHASEKIKAGDTAANFKTAIEEFYKDTGSRTKPTVTLTCEDATGVTRTCRTTAYQACLNPDNNSEEFTCSSC